jgi:gliding motility-associatede transport system auxiliary component
VRSSQGLLGLLGLILLAFATVAALLTRGATFFDVVYIAAHGVAGAAALVAYLSAGVENLRTFLGERSTKYGTSAVLASFFFIGILTAMNYLGTRYHHRFDLTEANVFSLSPQSKSVVRDLDKDLTLQAFVEGGVSPEVGDLLESYSYASPHVHFQMIDPDRNPELAERYNITAYNTVRIEYGEASTQVTQPSEETITNAIIKVTRTSRQTVCVIEGHGEPDIDDAEGATGLSQLKTALTNENYEVKKILLASLERVPEECNVVVVAGPARPFLEHETAALAAYLKGGGRGLFLLAPERSQELVPFLAPWGVKLGDDVVVDQVVRLFQGPALGLAPLVDTYDPAHEITREFKGRTLFPMTRSVSADTSGKPGITATELVKTSDSSWAETDLDALFQRQQASLDPADRKGPVSIAVAVEAKLKEMGEGEGVTRLVVFGSVEFADNQHLEGTYLNRDLLLNAVGWLVGQSDLLSIRSRTMRASRVDFSQEEATVIFYLSVLTLPELLLIVGLTVWWRRE